MSFFRSTPAASPPAALSCSRRAVLPHWQVRWAKRIGSGGGGCSGGSGTASLTTHSAQRVPLVVVTRRGGPAGTPRGRRSSNVSLPQLAKEYALPALGLLVAASVVGPLVGGLVMTALGLGAALAFGAAALSVSWVFIPLLAAVFGMPALMAGGMAAGVFATAAAGALLLPSLLQLALIGGGLWLGATVAKAYFGGGGGSSIDPDSTIDVEADSVDDDWRNEMFKEKQEREQELRDFDDLLRRRDDFKRRGPGGY